MTKFHLAGPLAALLVWASPGLAGDFLDPVAARAVWAGWSWADEPDPAAIIEIELIRAIVFVEPGTTPGVTITPGDADSGVTFAATRSDVGVTIRDVYPRKPRSMAGPDCLPPTSELGDFAAYPVRLVAVVRLPPGRQLRVRVMDGDVHVGKVDGRFDLATNRGCIARGGARRCTT